MRSLLVLVIGAVLLVAVGWGIVHANPGMVVLGVAGIGIFFITLTRLDVGLSLLVFFVPLTKQFNLSQVGSAPVDFGSDDVLVFCLVFGWLGYCARTKKVAFEKTGLNRPLLILFMAMMLSIVRVGLGYTPGNVQLSILHIMKWFEHALLFFLVASCVETRRDIEHYIWLMLVACGLVAVVQFFQMATGRFVVETWTPIGLLPRVGSVFDSIGILGAYYLLFIPLLAARVMNPDRPRLRWAYLGLLVTVSVALVTTYARAAYVGLVAGMVMLGVFSGGRRGYVIALAMVVLIPLAFNPWARLRVRMTVILSEGMSPGWTRRFEFEESWKARLFVWRQAREVFSEYPVRGIGFWASRYHPAFGGSTAHSQYLTALAELGVIGFAALVWLGARILGMAIRFLRVARDPPMQTLATGYLCGLIGVLVHALFGETLQAFRLMGPLWTLTGLVFAGLTITEREGPHV